MFPSLHPSFFPSVMFFLAMFTVVLLISSQGIQAVKQVKVGHVQELERNGWKRPLSFLIWSRDGSLDGSVPHWMGQRLLTSPFSNCIAAASMSAKHSRKQVGKTLLVFQLSLSCCHHSDRCYVKSTYCENSISCKPALGKLQKTWDSILIYYLVDFLFYITFLWNILYCKTII